MIATKIKSKDQFGQPHTYRSIYTWWNAMRRASRKVKLEHLQHFAKRGAAVFLPAEMEFIQSQIKNISNN